MVRLVGADSELLSFKASAAMKARITELSEERGLNRSAAIKAAILEATKGDAPDVPDKAELLELLGESSRSGNVTAMKTLWGILTAEEGQEQVVEDAVDELDELARRRA